jgi:hypothetical protein
VLNVMSGQKVKWGLGSVIVDVDYRGLLVGLASFFVMLCCDLLEGGGGLTEEDD